MFYSSFVGETWRPECPEDELLFAFVALKRAMAARTVGVDPGIYQVLHQLAVTGPVRQGALAELLGLDASTVSRHVRSLVKDGLIDASRDPADGRATQLSISDKGRARMTERLRLHRTRLQAATATFTPEERAELVRLLNTLAARLGDLEEPS